MAELDYDALQRWADAATPGPWESVDEDGEWYFHAPATGAYLVEYGADFEQKMRDIRFIAASRSAVPALLDRVRELEHIAETHAFCADRLSLETEERDAALSTIANVEALHTSEGWPLPGGRESKEYCTRCNCRWPCPTIRALGSVPSTGEGNE